MPLRATLEAFGAEVTWDSQRGMACAKKNGTSLYIPINNDYMLVNGQQVKNDISAVIVDGRTYCPIQKVMEAFGASVEWDSNNKSVSVDENIIQQLNTPEVEKYLPLQVGNQWSYQGIGDEYAQYTEKVLYREGNLIQTLSCNGGTCSVEIYEIKPDKVVCLFTENEFYEITNILKTWRTVTHLPLSQRILLYRLRLILSRTEEKQYNFL